MLTDKIKVGITVGIGPKPTLGTVVSGAVLVSSRQIPEGDSDVFAIDPFPVGTILRISHGSHPVLTARVAPVPSPQFPADEALKGWIALVDECSASASAEVQGITKIKRLPIVENVTFSVVGGRAPRRLVPELWTPFDRQCLPIKWCVVVVKLWTTIIMR